MTQAEITQALLDLKDQQLAGENLPCPRCGKYTMKPMIHTNALSRRADVYVCDLCGVKESVDAFAGKPKAVEEWAFFCTSKHEKI